MASRWRLPTARASFWPGTLRPRGTCVDPGPQDGNLCSGELMNVRPRHVLPQPGHNGEQRTLGALARHNERCAAALTEEVLSPVHTEIASLLFRPVTGEA